MQFIIVDEMVMAIYIYGAQYFKEKTFFSTMLWWDDHLKQVNNDENKSDLKLPSS